MSLGRAEIPVLGMYKHGVSCRCCRAASLLLSSERWSCLVKAYLPKAFLIVLTNSDLPRVRVVTCVMLQ